MKTINKLVIDHMTNYQDKLHISPKYIKTSVLSVNEK